jgi:hypothetical protein
MLIEISIGEALDRLSILELKMEKINDRKKIEEIQKDISTLCEAQKYKLEGPYYYKLLFYVNKEIWNLTDTIKQLDYTDTKFAKISYTIFELNQSRFRVKNIINKIYQSNINEQKSYKLTEIHFNINDSSLLECATLLNRLSYISLQYDILKISCSEAVKEHIIKNIPRFNYIFEESSDKLQSIDDLDIHFNLDFQ